MVNVPGGHDYFCVQCGEEFLCPDSVPCIQWEEHWCPACWETLNALEDAPTAGGPADRA